MRIIIIYDEKFFYRAVLEVESEEDIEENIKKKKSNYNEIVIPKHNGNRKIQCLKRDCVLFQLQRNMVDNFFSKIPLPDNVFGFVKSKSYRDFLIPHVANTDDARFYLRLDITDFFGSINSRKIKDAIGDFIVLKDTEKDKLLKIISELCTLDDYLPQGSVTSPVISNIVFKRLDIRIRNYCRKLNVTYSRYADDLLFSSEKERNLGGFFVKKIIGILKTGGFLLNRTKVKRGNNEISLNGFIVGKNIRLSRTRKKDIVAFFHVYERGGKPRNIDELLQKLNEIEFQFRKKLFTSKTDIINYLAGYRSFIIDWLPDDIQGNIYKDLTRVISKIQDIVFEIEALEE